MRKHFERPVQDKSGNLMEGSAVRLLDPGSMDPITDLVYVDDSTETTWGNPWTTDSGVIDFYLAQSREVDIEVTLSGEGGVRTFQDVQVGVPDPDLSGVQALVPNNGAKAVGQGELVLNVRDQFGATGDGVTNDGTAIVAANTAAGLAITSGWNSVVVYFPWTPKGYICNSTIAIKDGVTYRGERRVRIRHGASTTAHFNSQGAQGWTVENFTLDDSNGMCIASPMRMATASRRFTIRNIKFVGGMQGLSNPIVNKQVTANVATLETADPHGLQAGSIAHLSGMPPITAPTTPIWDGDWTVLDTPTPTSFTFAITTNDQPSVAVNGGWLNGETLRSLTEYSVTANVATFTTAAPHNYVANQYIWITGVEGENDGGGNGVLSSGQVKVLSVIDDTHFTCTVTQTGTHPNLGLTAITPNGTSGVNTGVTSIGGRQHAVDHQGACEDGLIEDCWFQAHSNNIRIPDVKRITVQRCLFTNWSDRCFFVISQTTGSCEDVWILNNKMLDYHIGGAPRQPIAVQCLAPTTFPNKRLRIEGNLVIGPNRSWTARDPGTADQISVQSGEDYRIINNISMYGGDLGIHGGSGASHKGLIANNICIGNDTAGINVGAASGVQLMNYDATIANNVLVNNGQGRSGDRGHPAALTASNWNRVTYSGNHIGDDQTTLIGTGEVTFTDTGDLVTTPAPHGLVDGDKVKVAVVTGTTGITATRDYIVKSSTSTTFQITDQPGGVTLPLTTNGTGTGLVKYTPTQTRGYYFRQAYNFDVKEGHNNSPIPYEIDTLSGGCTGIKGLFRTATLLSPLSITNTPGPAAIWTPPVVPIGMFEVGSIFEYDLAGTIDCKASSGNFSMRLAFGAISVGSFVVAASQTNAATNLGWNARMRLIVEALGTSGVVSVTGMNSSLAVAGTTWTVNNVGQYGTVVSLSSGLNPTVSGVMVTADPANVLRLNRATMRQVN